MEALREAMKNMRQKAEGAGRPKNPARTARGWGAWAKPGGGFQGQGHRLGGGGGGGEVEGSASAPKPKPKPKAGGAPAWFQKGKGKAAAGPGPGAARAAAPDPLDSLEALGFAREAAAAALAASGGDVDAAAEALLAAAGAEGPEPSAASGGADAGAAGEAVDYLAELEKALACLISSSKAEDALPTLGKLIGNVAKDPGNAKFRRLRLGNPKIKAVVAAPGAADLLALVGFVPEQGSFGGYFNERWLVLPEGDDGSRAHDAASLIWSVLLPQGGPPAPAAAAKDPLDRFWQVFLPSEGVMRIELPDSFFQRSPLEIKLEYQKRKVDSATNGKLLTKAMREKYAKKKKPVYRSCVLRVRVPAGHYVQSVFTPREKLRDAYRFVAAAMQTAPAAFDLFAHPSRTPLPDSEGEALRDAGLVPAAILNFKWKGEPAGALRPDMLEAAVPLQAGAQSWV